MAPTSRPPAAVGGRETSHRFAERVRGERRRRRRRWLAAGGVLVILGTSVVFLARSAVFRVQSVVVSGAKRQPVDEVLRAAGIRPGAPMWTLDPSRAGTRVGTLPRIRSVTVTRSWPRRVDIAITERQPVAVVAAPPGGHLVVDSGAAEIERLAGPPAGLLAISLIGQELADTAEARRPLVTAALSVAVVLPKSIRARLAKITVVSVEQIDVILTDSSVVHWGNASRSERKAAVLAALLATRHAVYDVRAPDTPSVR